MKHGPHAKTDVDNAKALTDLTTAEVTRRRRASITAAVENPPAASTTDRTVRWTAKWKCPACRAWTNDPISKSCLSCAKQRSKD